METSRKLDAEQQKIVDFMNNETKLQALAKMKTAAEAVNYFNAHGIEMDEEKLKGFLEIGIKMHNKNRKLTEDDLKKVTGGGYYYYIFRMMQEGIT